MGERGLVWGGLEMGGGAEREVEGEGGWDSAPALKLLSSAEHNSENWLSRHISSAYGRACMRTTAGAVALAFLYSLSSDRKVACLLAAQASG